MADKSLRILLADAHPMQLMQLEKMLNGMGYYRIAPVQSFDDLRHLVQNALLPFNLLIGNIDLASHVGVDLERFCRVNVQIQHALLYESQHLKMPAVPAGQRQAVSISLPKVPDDETLHAFMAVIDGPRLIAQLPTPAGRGGGRGPARHWLGSGQTVFSRPS